MRFIFTILFTILFTSGCVTRKEVESELWMHDQIPEHLCTADIASLGIYRVLPCTPDKCVPGQRTYEEVLPFCHPRIKTFLAADQEKVAAWLAELTKPKR